MIVQMFPSNLLNMVYKVLEIKKKKHVELVVKFMNVPKKLTKI